MDDIGKAALIVANLELWKFWVELIMLPIVLFGFVFFIYKLVKSVE